MRDERRVETSLSLPQHIEKKRRRKEKWIIYISKERDSTQSIKGLRMVYSPVKLTRSYMWSFMHHTQRWCVSDMVRFMNQVGPTVTSEWFRLAHRRCWTGLWCSRANSREDDLTPYLFSRGLIKNAFSQPCLCLISFIRSPSLILQPN